eukprot:gnl/TRDRNA2_/TRDRNA2_125987_c1_seq1.p1 gnl/TRDRNA2_/TRDRNA2_125987_c1~~gnl/TRDRNA2_/TRDRNA2_125987_c1_seq1.p1  ORF type:complete len:332 (-),score=49.48 gnl/TRDRNA2_/TRDRNA2_125987_c1_seq1:50-1045(-)
MSTNSHISLYTPCRTPSAAEAAAAKNARCCPMRTVCAAPAPAWWTSPATRQQLGAFGEVAGVWVVAASNDHEAGAADKGAELGLCMFQQEDNAIAATLKPLAAPVAHQAESSIKVALLVDRPELVPRVWRTTPPSGVISIWVDEQAEATSAAPPAGGSERTQSGAAAAPPATPTVPQPQKPLTAAQMFTKATPCAAFLKGACKFGSSGCAMAHSLQEVAQARRPYLNYVRERRRTGDSSSSSADDSSRSTGSQMEGQEDEEYSDYSGYSEYSDVEPVRAKGARGSSCCSRSRSRSVRRSQLPRGNAGSGRKSSEYKIAMREARPKASGRRT